MSRYTVYNLAVDVKAKLHGIAIIGPTLQRCLDEGRRRMIRNIKPPEIVRSMYMEQALYDQIQKYAIPEDLKYDNVLEIHQLASYRNVDTLQHPLSLVYRRQFDQQKRGSKNVMAIANENGVKYAMINHPRGLKQCQHLLLNDMDTLNKNGSWNVGGNVVDLRLDQLNHVTGKASLLFDIDGSSSTGFIENHTMNAVDIHDYLNTGAAFAWLSLPIPKEMLTVKMTLGSDASNLTTDIYTATVNQPHDSNEFITGWNLLKYMLNNLNSTGNPNPKAIVYIRFDFTTTGQPIPNCNLDNAVVRKGVVYWMLYNSQYCLIDPVSGAWKQRTTRNTDILPLEEDTYGILMLETALSAMQERYGNNFGSSTDVTDLQSELEDCYSQYKLMHTDESIEPSDESYCLGTYLDGYTTETIDSGYDNDGGSMDRVGQNNQSQ